MSGSESGRGIIRKLCIAGAVLMAICALTLEIVGLRCRIPSVEDLALTQDSELDFRHEVTVPTGVEGESLEFSYWAMKGYQGVVSLSRRERTGAPYQPWYSVSGVEGPLQPGNGMQSGAQGGLHIGTSELVFSLGGTAYLYPVDLDGDGEKEVFIHQAYKEPVTRAGYIRPGTYVLDYGNGGWQLRPYRSWMTFFRLESRRRGFELRLVLAAVALIASLQVGRPGDRWKSPAIGLAAALGFLFLPCGILCPALVIVPVVLRVYVGRRGLGRPI